MKRSAQIHLLIPNKILAGKTEIRLKHPQVVKMQVCLNYGSWVRVEPIFTNE